MTEPNRRRLLAAAALAGALPLAAPLARAQAWPAKPIRLIVPFPAGGTADFAARTIAGALQQGLGQQVIVENRGGADGVVASQAVMQAPPDGYTLYFATTTGLNAAPVLHKPTPYDPLSAFVPIAQAGFFGFFLMSHESVPAKTAQELVAYARANPGKLSYGTGNGTSILTTAQLAAAEKLDMVHVPYKGDAPAGLDFIAGRIQLMIATPTPAIQAQIKEGKLRVLATLLPNRSPLYPNAPTAAEAGLKGMTITPWGGLFGPVGTPREVIDRVSREMRAVAQRKDIRDTLDGIAYELAGSGPEEMAQLLASQLQVWRRAVQDLNIAR